VVDTTTFTVIEMVNVGLLPVEVEVHGDRVYVATLQGVAVFPTAPAEIAV
jgi:hypothetical protein